LKWLPGFIAGPLLMKAIVRHAWTFAGSAKVSARANRLVIDNNPLCLHPCVWHEAVLQRLMRELVDPGATVVETGCTRSGAHACTFEFHRSQKP